MHVWEGNEMILRQKMARMFITCLWLNFTKHYPRPEMVTVENTCWLPSGKRLNNYGKSLFSMGKSTMSMAIFHSCTVPAMVCNTFIQLYNII